MKDIQAIVLDLDGTLLNSSKNLSPRNLRALQECHAAGLHVIVATARPPRAVRNLLHEVPFVDWVVFYNGALITRQTSPIKKHIGISSDISRQISEFIETHEPQSHISYEVNDSWYTPTPVTEAQYAWLGIRAADPMPEVVDQNFIQNLSPTKILVLGHNHWRAIDERFGEHVNVIATDGEALIQIMHKQASKESAVNWIMETIDVNASHVMAFGDDFNDLGLFQSCGFPIAMGNAINELKAYSNFVTASNDDDGVAVALEKFVL